MKEKRWKIMKKRENRMMEKRKTKKRKNRMMEKRGKFMTKCRKNKNKKAGKQQESAFMV